MQTNLNILLIDDDKAFIDTIALQLRNERRHTTIVVYDPLEGIQKLETTTSGIDVILLDYEMPNMTGLDVLRWMKKNRKETPAIMLTAHDSGTIAEQAMKLGAYDYLRKDKLDVHILTHAIDATHERHLYRIDQEFEEQRMSELSQDRVATDKVRDILNTIAPPLHTALANINYELETKCGAILNDLSPASREQVRGLFDSLQKEMRILEMSVRGLLTLYRILYARHGEQSEIDEIRKEIEEGLKPVSGRKENPV